MGRLAGERSRTWVRSLGVTLIVLFSVLVWGVGSSRSWSQAGAPALPELHPFSLVLSPASPVDKGVALLARAKIINTGSSPAPRFSVEFFYRLKSDPIRPWVSFPDGKGLVIVSGGLSPRDQAITVEGTLDTAKAEIEPGNYEIRVLVDSANQISEEDETNNELIVGIQIRPSRLNIPDLVPIALTFDPPSPIEINRGTTVTATIRNGGPTSTGAFDVQYLFCKLPAPHSTCPQLNEFARETLSEGLGPGEERSGQKIDFPNTRDPSMAQLEPGTYLIQVRVDPPSKEQPSGAVEEQDEANNTLTAYLMVKGPELSPESILLSPTPVRAGDETLVTVQIANTGDAPAKDVTIEFFVNGRRFATAVVPEIAAASAPGQPGRQSATASLKTAELSLQPGIHELRVVVDPDNRISEPDESNNILTTALTLQPPLPRLPELTPKSLIVAPSSPIEQGKGTVIAEILNNGMRIAEGFDVEFSVREAGRLRWNPIPCTANCTANRLNPHAELTAQAQLPELTPGAYEVRIVIDPQGRVAELDETNNEMAIGFRVIRPRRPDLAITEFAFDPPSLTVHRGQPVRIRFTVENIGDAPLLESSEAHCAYRRLEDVTGAPVSFARVALPPLVPGGRFAAECRLETGPPVRPGFYELTVTLDPQNQIEEQNEANNIVTSGTGIPGQAGQGQALLIFGPDLFPDRATLKVNRAKTPQIPLGSLEITQGEMLDLEVTIRNSGQIAAGGFDVAFCIREYFSQQPCTEIGTRSRTTGLGLADEFTAKTQVSTEIFAPGVYELGVIVDPPTPDQPFGRVEEVSELNNFLGGPGGARGFQVVIVGKPDLTFREPLVFHPSGPVPVGTLLGVFADIQNIGAGRTTREFKAEFAFRRVDDPAQPSPEFTVFGTALVTELEVGPDKAKQVKGELDTSNLAPGLYEIRVTLDPDNVIPELNETNNTHIARVAIGGGGGLVDLAALSLTMTPTQPSRGQIVRLWAVIANLGAVSSGEFVVEFSYRNLLSSPGTEPVFSRQTVPNLDGNAQTTLNAQLNTISLSPGTYEIAVTVDPDNRISEPDEANNRVVVFLTIN